MEALPLCSCPISVSRRQQKDCEKMFTELINSMKRRCSEVKTLIGAQEKAELTRAEELRVRLDHELTELRTKIAEMQQLLSTNDHIEFMRVTYHTGQKRVNSGALSASLIYHPVFL